MEVHFYNSLHIILPLMEAVRCIINLMLKLGIVTTIADARDSIDAFIFYHQQVGFNYFYIFIDDNDQDVLLKLSKYPQVQVFLKDQSLRAAWEQHLECLGEEKKNLIDKEVMVRQELNFYVAFHLARGQGVDWLLHIDLDELFYPNGHNVEDYFAHLQLNDIASVTYLNYESISTELESENIYLSASYFKINHFKNRHWFYTTEQKEFFKHNNWLKEKYFLYYQNGKSSISTFSGKITFYDVHSIAGEGKRKMGNHKDPIILHFPSARFSDFVKKYKRLGDFSDKWLGAPRVGVFIDEFHLHARNAFLDHSEGDLKSFYLTNCTLRELEIASLVQLGLAIHIGYHLKILKNPYPPI